MKSSLLLTTLLALPSINGALANANVNTNDIELNINNDIQEEEKIRECTFMYVGKKCSNTGMAMVARTGDSPKGINHNMRIVAHNELANKTIEGVNGFTYKMPSTTYRYIGTPRNWMSGAANHWEVSCVNEKGVTVSATLSCSTAGVFAGWNSSSTKHEDGLEEFVKTGIGEDNLAQVVAATSATAKEGVLRVAEIMKTQGSSEPNAIMIQDKDEVWYMELYTGHQFCAIKMPDDKCCTIGNEFMLNTLDELGINASNEAQMCVHSENLWNLPHANELDKYPDGTAKPDKDIYHMHLFNTYAGDTRTQYAEPKQGGMINACHMRTWRGRDLYAKTAEKENYAVDKKYSPFWAPEKLITINDVIFFMRDRFESILNGTGTDTETFKQVLAEEGKLRAVGTETAYQIHIMMVDPTLPTEVSATEWVCLSNSLYAPFVPINAGITSMNDYYTHQSKYFGYDPESAICIYRNLNTLAQFAEQNNTHDGLKYFATPIRNMLIDNETIWQTQYYQLVKGLNKYNLNQQKQILTNYVKTVQTQALTMSYTVWSQLMSHLETVGEKKPKPVEPTDPSYPAYENVVLFRPLVNLRYYSWVYGWNYSFDNNTKVATMTKGDETITVDLHYWYGQKGSLVKNGGTAIPINVSIVNDMAYIDYTTAKESMATGYEISTLNLNDYLDATNPSKIVIPVVFSVAILACLAIIFIPIISKKVKAKKATKTTASK